MIINVKSFMAAVMAVILVLAVVVPITSAMVGVAGQKVMSDNELSADEYLMSKSAAASSPRIVVTDNDGTIELRVDTEVTEISNRTVVFGDTFVLNFMTVLKFYDKDQTVHDEGYPTYTSESGDYFIFENGTWTLYSAEQQGGGAKTDGVKDYSARDFEDPDAKAALMERVPAVNKQLFTEKQLELMVKEGIDILRAATVKATGTYGWVVYPDTAGDLMHAQSLSADVYVDSGSTVYVAGASEFYGGRFLITGTLSSLRTVFADGELTDIQAHYTPTAFSNKFTDVTFEELSETHDIHNIVVPLKYTSNVDSGLAGTLVSLVPVVLIVGLIIGLVSVWFIRRGGEEF